MDTEDLSVLIKEDYETPPAWSPDYALDGNAVRQALLQPFRPTALTKEGENYFLHNHAERYELLQPGQTSDSTSYFKLLKDVEDNSPDLDNVVWVAEGTRQEAAVALSSLQGRFIFKESGIPSGTKGLRTPQIGALHAVLGHWSLDISDPVTVVMPTGTGKTETMLALYAHSAPKKLMVLVPTDKLREQISGKFETLGKLRELGILLDGVSNPVVGVVKHGFESTVQARAFVESCNVIVTTPDALLASDEEVWKSVTAACSHLFIDEAHHSAAKTWQMIGDEFMMDMVVQFTATPYRNDGKLMRGKIIYNFPLLKAQQQQYFSPINYISVFDINDPDRAIAQVALEQLRKDRSSDFDHILMARCRTITHANKLLELYKELAPEFNPVITYSTQKPSEKQVAITALTERSSRLIVCVDMLGEGFDLPSLKIAAIHGQHQSLGVTLQFIGRFARVSSVGLLSDATVVVSRTETQTDTKLQQLYSEDSDWNEIITELSAEAINEQVEIDEFEGGFAQIPPEISLRNLEPKMSTVVYKTSAARWHPEVLKNKIKKDLYTKKIAVNETEHVLWFVTKNASNVTWGNIKDIEDITYGLIVCYWDKEHQLLYINSSANDGVYGNIAKALFDDNAEHLKGTDVFRTLANINRRIPTNVGTKNILTNVFAMMMGSRIEFTEAFKRNSRQTNIFAHGFNAEDGSRIAIGASVRGRIWSTQSATNLKEWTTWCDTVGQKIDDSTINVDEVIDGFILPTSIEERPELVPLLIEWSTDVYMNTSESLKIDINGVSTPLIDCEMRITDFKKDGAIPFTLFSEDQSADFNLTITAGKMQVRPVRGEAQVYTRSTRTNFADYSENIGFRVLFEQQTVLEPDMTLLTYNESVPPIALDKIKTYDWSGINLRTESWGIEKKADTVQARAVDYVLAQGDWDVVIDDDGSGEIADIVALKCVGNVLHVNLVHCKFSSKGTAGARIKDLYEVCGQAQKSIQRRRNPEDMLRNLLRREARRRRTSGRNNFIVGDEAILNKLVEKSNYLQHEFTVTIVQPGVSKAIIKPSMLSLLAATESYVVETGGRNASLDILVSS
jgi:superfamily II DNA or RNA helicase